MRSFSLPAIAAGLLVLAGAAPLLGHAVLTKSSLEGTTVRAGVPITVTLGFNTALEAGFTRVLLVNERDEARALELLPPSGRGTVTVSLPALVPGTYGLRYKVLAADGHVTESLLRFKVTEGE